MFVKEVLIVLSNSLYLPNGDIAYSCMPCGADHHPPTGPSDSNILRTERLPPLAVFCSMSEQKIRPSSYLAPIISVTRFLSESRLGFGLGGLGSDLIIGHSRSFCQSYNRAIEFCLLS